MQANYSENEIQSVLQKVKIFNKNIGTYQMFVITENFDYAVKLSNGKINLKVEELQDDANDALTPERLQNIAQRFKPDNPDTNTSTNSAKSNTQTTIPITPTKPKKKTGLIVTIVVIVLVGLAAIPVIINNTGSTYSPGGYEETKMTVEEMERANPTEFITADGTYKENFWGTKMKVNCQVTNKATVASYKDVVIEVIFFSSTETELSRARYTIYQVFPPGSNRSVELKIDRPDACTKLGWNAVEAVPL